MIIYDIRPPQKRRTSNVLNLRKRNQIVAVTKINRNLQRFFAMVLIFLLAITFGIWPAKIARADISTGIVGWWRLDDGSGTTAQDSSGNSNIGNLVNSPTWTTGHLGGGLDFDGVDDSINAGSGNSLDNISAITISFWAKPDNYGENNNGYIMDKGWWFGSGWKVAVSNSGAGKRLGFYAIYSGTDLERQSAAFAANGFGQWDHYVITWDGTASSSGVHIYLNGVEASYPVAGVDATGDRANDATRNLTIGNEPNGTRTLDGVLDDIRIYSRVLSSEDIAELYAYTPETTPPTVSITSPSNNDTVSGTISVTADASDNVGVVGVQFKLDGSNLGSEDTSSPYSISWDTTSASNGSKVLTAVARDEAGNSTTSDGITVTVDNPDVTPPARSNGSPSSNLNSGTTQTDISLTTNEEATCKFDTVANTAYADMINSFTATDGGTTHTATVTGLSDGQSYHYYVRCQDLTSNANTDDYEITFRVTDSGTIYAESCSVTDVQAAVDLAETGDTISIPAGNCTWSSGISLSDSTKITVRGAGANSTVITRNPAGPAFSLNRSGSRITALGFINGTIDADGYDFRIDHNSLTFDTWSDGISIMSRNINPAVIPTGVVDNNSLTNMRILVNGTNYLLSESAAQNGLWASSLNLGSSEAVYIEDNVFETGSGGINAVDGNYGGRYVFRYNTLNGLQIEAHSVQGNNRAIRKWEVYGNIIGNTGSNIYYPFRLRGGTGLVFFNLVTGNWTNDGIGLDNVRSFSDVGDGGLCDGDSLWDGNEDTTGYPCRDQIGRSADSPEWVDSPPATYTQSLVPTYAWSNKTEAGVEVPFNVINPPSPNHIQANRDYYNYSSSFDGTSGTGAGPLYSRPATCTTGVGYWATNQSVINLTGMVGANPTTPISGTFYKCTSTNTWTTYYTPYTYPHPLRSESEAVPPQVTAFTIPATASSLTIDIITFTATDDTGVTGYLITETSSTPSAGDSGWSATAQTTYTFSSDGAKTLYAWAKDAAGNISTSLSDTVTVDSIAPVRSAGSPSGSQSAGTTQVTLSLTTDENATCKYSTSAGTAYGSMTDTFSTTGSTSHSTTISGLSNGNSYNYYVRCTDGSNTNTDDYTISFSVTSPVSSGGSGSPAMWTLPTFPLGGFKLIINNGTPTTSNRNVTLNFNAGTDIKKMAISITGDFTDASQEDYTPTKQWDLCSKFGGLIKNPTCPDGKYTVYAQFYTAYGRTSASAMASSSIILNSNVINSPAEVTTDINQKNTTQPPFTKPLKYGMYDADVKRLQIFLNLDPETMVDSKWVGSPGHETNFFGPKTWAAVRRFQEKYGKDILSPWNLIRGTGYVGKTTLAKLNELISKIIGQ